MNQLRLAKIFLAEDSKDDVEITRRALKRGHLGCELIVARDGVEALEMLRDPKMLPHIALLDLNLPKMSGLEVLEQIRREPTNRILPVIILSASSRQEDIARSYELGAQTYIQKPVVFEDFVAVLELLNKYWFEVAELPRHL